MYKTLALILIFAFVASAYQEEDANLESSIGTKVSELIKKLENVVNNAVSKAKGKFTGAKTHVDTTAAEVKGKKHLALQEQIESFQKEIDGLKFLGTDDLCFEKTEQALIESSGTLSENMFQCVDALVEKAANAIQDGYTRISKIVNDVTHVKQEFKDCGSGIKAALCYTKLVAKLGEDIVTFPVAIDKDVNDVIYVVDNIIPEIKDCASKALTRSQSQGEILMNGVADCQ